MSSQTTPLDFIVVGAGAAGCPLAARLAERGYVVLVVEMGPERPLVPAGSAAESTEVPLLHPEASEDPRHLLKYFVKHFDADPGGSRDWKIHNREGQGDDAGIFYPRAQGVGGCTLHNAMITVCGPSDDWDEIADLTNDKSWSGERMRYYFQRIEQCLYAQPKSLWERWKAFVRGRSGWEDCRHGTEGWLTTGMSDTSFAKRDKMILRVMLQTIESVFDSGLEQLSTWVTSLSDGTARTKLDPNHWRNVGRRQVGFVQIPCAIDTRGRRSSPRQRLLETKVKYPNQLHILCEGLVTEITLVGKRAVGIQFLPKAHVYEADANPVKVNEDDLANIKGIRCKREVILCAGAFNSPQLLMLSGIGPEAHLKEREIEIKHRLDGVGENLQDRYEVSIVSTLKDRFQSLDGVGLSSCLPGAEKDIQLNDWLNVDRSVAGTSPGIYSTNGALLGIFKRSTQEDEIPDLFILAMAGRFAGYRVGWSNPDELVPVGVFPKVHRTVTWLILKARNRNRTGYVRLRSKHPWQRPEINFRSFSDPAESEADLAAIEEGVELITGMLDSSIKRDLIQSYELPDRNAFGDLRDWIRHTSWGHHACGTCRIGTSDDDLAVVDSRFRVHGIQGLRVIDASVFPKTPGYFIVTNVYMIAEKGADVLTEDHPIAATANSNGSPVIYSHLASSNRAVYPVELENAEAELILQRRKAAGI